jgi:predicted dinucleotide-binding enzyme
MTDTSPRTIGFIGAGHIGSTLARLAVEHGHRVVLSNSRGPETLADLVAELGSEASAGSPEDAAKAGDLVVVTIPVKGIDSVPVAPLAGKVVIDTNNYYPQRDGQIEDLDEHRTTSSSLLQQHLPDAKVVKAFNHIRFSDIPTDGAPAGTPGRRALAVFGDDAEAKSVVAALIDEFGFDVVDGGPLAESWRIEPGTPGYVTRVDADQLREVLAEAKR